MATTIEIAASAITVELEDAAVPGGVTIRTGEVATLTFGAAETVSVLPLSVDIALAAPVVEPPPAPGAGDSWDFSSADNSAHAALTWD